MKCCSSSHQRSLSCSSLSKSSSESAMSSVGGTSCCVTLWWWLDVPRSTCWHSCWGFVILLHLCWSSKHCNFFTSSSKFSMSFSNAQFLPSYLSIFWKIKYGLAHRKTVYTQGREEYRTTGPLVPENINSAGREITAGQRTMSGQNAELSAQILTLPVILTRHFR